MTAGGDRPAALHLAALAGLSATVLAFEILLLRLFEFSHWHHFAGLAVSLALLGFGAAGTTLALAGERATRRPDAWFLAGLLVAAAGLLLVLVLHSRIALRPLFAAWDAHELTKLMLVDFVAFVPFYGAGLSIGQVFMRWPRATRALYAANLIGSGAGCVLAGGLLMSAQVETGLALLATLLAVLGAALASAQRLRVGAAVALALALGATGAALRPPAPAVSDFKALSRLQELPGAEVLDVAAGLPGRLTLVRADSLRTAPGLSLAWPEAVPAMDAAVLGSDRVVPVPRAWPNSVEHLEASLAGLPFALRPHGGVLLLGSGAWSAAVAGDGRPITRVEPDARLARLAGARGTPETYRDDGAYRYLVRTRESFAVIVAANAYEGGDAATEDYLLTVEGLTHALAKLDANGLLEIPLESHYPPRHFARVLATVERALERSGNGEPGARVAVLRGLQSVSILASPAPLPAQDIAAIRTFATRWQFDLAWLPGLARADTNRYHRLDEPAFFDTAQAVFTDAPLPDTSRWYATGAAELQRPYIWRSLEWARLPDFVHNLGRQGLTYLDWTLILAAVTTVVVIVLAFLLIVAPLGRLPAPAPPFGRAAVAGYFTLLGLGYMLLEMAVFQRAILFAGEAVLAAIVVFAVFLIGSGLGSAAAPEARSPRMPLVIFGAIGAGFVLATAVLFLAPEALLAPGPALRMTLLAACVLPLAWALGRPFPWALRQLADRPRWIPWAWGINGFASVAAASLAPLVSVHYGQQVTLVAGLACYAVAALIAWRWTHAY